MGLPNEQTVVVAGYERISVVGRGPRSEVWRARSKSGREVALKIFSPALTSRPNFVTVFEKETSALSSLVHPHILRVFERGKAGGTFFVSSELMGGSLRSVMRSGPPMAHYDAARLGITICEALDLGHSRGLPHRHLVPENIFVESPGRVRVSDFGLALLDRPQSEMVLADARADLYALGALLYELVTGKAPGPSPSETGLSARLDETLMRALSPIQSRRFGRASEMALSLLLVTSNGVKATPAAPVQVSVNDDCITLTIGELTTAGDVEAAVPDIERVMGQKGGWKLAYELGGMTVMDGALQEALLQLHTRHRRKLDRVGFCSSRAIVRSGALVVGGSVRGLPWKVFAAPESMRQWIAGRLAT